MTIATCAKCGAAITDQHSYTWCHKCGEPLPSQITARLPRVQAARAAAAAATARQRQQPRRRTAPSWRSVIGGVLLAVGATTLHRADRGSLEVYTKVITEGVIAVVLFISEYRRNRRMKLAEATQTTPARREAEHGEEQGG